MFVKKAGGKVFGADLTAAEKKALDIEIKRELAENNRENFYTIDAIMVWWVWRRLGLGKKRLKEFYQDFKNEYKRLIDHYEMGGDAGSFLCRKELLEAGYDLEAWDRES